MKKKTIVRIVSVFLLTFLVFGFVAFIIYNQVTAPAFDITEDRYLLIDDRKTYPDVLLLLKDTVLVKNLSFFKFLAGWMQYPDNIKSGRYRITPELSYMETVRILRSGRQEPVKFTFNNIRFKEDFVKKVGQQFMLTEEELLGKMNDSQVVFSYGFDTATIPLMFIPNTYELYWNTSVELFLDRMKKEYDRFWTLERLEKANQINLSPVEVAILASIVEEETTVQSEYPVVAGLYLNRLKKGMLLQADPTVKYAVGDISLRRILYKHLEVESPYNTYKYAGLPPGPIRIPSIQAIDGILNYQGHSYLYMCAKEDFSGRHNFAATAREHNRNARNYQAALNRLGIR